MNLISAAILNTFSAEGLRSRYESFEWKGRGIPHAWADRESLAQALGMAIDAGSEPDMVIALERIHRWGLFGGLPAAIGANTSRIMAVLREARCGRLPNDGVDELLRLPRIGIATLSKWICLVDHNRYAIYDSRVSVALKDIRVDGVRQFPVVPRRATRHRQPWPHDRAGPAFMAERYAAYIEALGAIAPEVRMRPAQIEMALFMIGDVACENIQEWKCLRGSLA